MKKQILERKMPDGSYEWWELQKKQNSDDFYVTVSTGQKQDGVPSKTYKRAMSLQEARDEGDEQVIAHIDLHDLEVGNT